MLPSSLETNVLLQYRVIEAACDGVLMTRQIEMLTLLFGTMTEIQKEKTSIALTRLELALYNCDKYLKEAMLDSRMNNYFGCG